MVSHRKLVGSKEAVEAQAQKLVRELSIPSPEIAALEAEIERFERLEAGTQAEGLKFLTASRPLREMQVRLAQSREKEKDRRAIAAFRLGELRHPLAVEPLIAALQDPYPLVRRHAVSALGLLGDPRAIRPLTLLLDEGVETNVHVRNEALRALEKLKI